MNKISAAILLGALGALPLQLQAASPSANKLAAVASVDAHAADLTGLSDKIWAYAETALSPEFREVYGALVNAQMRVRSQVQQEVERIGVDLGMPTRTELNSVHKRMHDLRRDLRAGAGADASAKIEALRAEVRQLREQLRARDAKPAHAAPTGKPKTQATPARKRAAAVAKPRAASKQSGPSFTEALQAMKKTSGSRK